MIYFDNIIFSLQKAGGISLVWSELLKGIEKSDSEEYMCIEFNDSLNNIFRKTVDVPINKIQNNHYSLISLQRYINPQISYNDNQPFIFHSSYYRYSSHKKAINITTVHDFTYEYFVKGPKKVIHSWQKNNAIKNSDYLICISETTKSDLLRFIPNIDEKKIQVIYNGVSNDYHPVNSHPNKYDQLGTFALFVGGRSGYKNFLLAVNAIKETSLKLVIVGNKLSDKERLYLNEQLGQKRFHDLGFLSNEDLNLLYNQAFCLLYTSEYEGFGIPVLEAQRSGCPVITIDAPSILEIIGNKTLVAKSSASSLLEKINLLYNLTIRNEIIEQGFKNSMKYSWDQMIVSVCNLYEKALRSK